MSQTEIYIVQPILDTSSWGFWDWMASFNDVRVYDPHGRDGEWHAVVTLPHEVIEWEGYGVPAFEGDVERIGWERERGR